MKRDLALGGVVGSAVGAGLAYWLDPQSGRRRRARMSDRLAHSLHEVDKGAQAAARDLKHRAKGAARSLEGRLRHDTADDSVIADRVRSALGHVCSHPGAIDVAVHDGLVVLSGSILAAELKRTLERVAKVRGVREVDGDLAVHEDTAGVPSLQGGTPRRRERPALLQEIWSPAVRLFAGAAGVGLITFGGIRRGALGSAAALVGLLLSARSLSNMSLRRLTGIGAGYRAVDVVKTIHVDAPVEEVYRFWRSFENFPRFMAHVVEVTPVGEGAHRWRVAGPGGKAFSWESTITRERTNEEIAWQSIGDSEVESAGSVRFDAEGDRTRIHIRMSYNPPAGAFGHELAKLFGADPKARLDADLLRFKSLIEEGKATAEETVTREELPQ